MSIPISHENLYLTFRQMGGQGAFLLPASSQLHSAQNNPYAKVTYSATLQPHFS